MVLFLVEDMTYTYVITATVDQILIVGLATRTTSTNPTNMFLEASKVTRPWVVIQRGNTSRLLKLRFSAWCTKTSD